MKFVNLESPNCCIMKIKLTILFVAIYCTFLVGQDLAHPCSDASITERHLAQNPNFLEEKENLLRFTQEFVEQLRIDRSNSTNSRIQTTYQIPVVLHIFHWGEDGKMKLPQVLSGLKILNDDYNGRNADYDEVDAGFLDVRGKMDIEFCLATIDPDGNPTNGILYHEDEQALINEGDLFRYAWDNFKYLNIYIPKYVFGGPSDFTAYAYYPSVTGSQNNTGGIFYSSIRWGYGENSILEDGAEWASIITHEAGHWLNVRHTFESGCNQPGDFIDDTPYTTGTGVELEGCYNNDFSCGVSTNGSNYMDYNADCKRMFTQGQVDWMIAALNSDARFPLWQEENLMATGCMTPLSNSLLVKSNEIKIYPNPASQNIDIECTKVVSKIEIYNAKGIMVYKLNPNSKMIELEVSNFPTGIYFYKAFGQDVRTESQIQTGKFMIH